MTDPQSVQPPKAEIADPTRPATLARSIGAVFVGMVAVFVLSLGTDAALRAVHFFPPYAQRMSDPLFGVAAIYRVIYGILGGYITATLAPNRRMQHAMFYGLVGFGLSLIGFIATRNMPELGPRWYPLALVITSIPCAWVGGLLRMRRSD
jgi:FtsH-binding integral membrane protein